jgi:hypothetical protein
MNLNIKKSINTYLFIKSKMYLFNTVVFIFLSNYFTVIV